MYVSKIVRKFIFFQICLAHCYRVNDAGIQWLVGSCYSPKIQKLNLSNTELTGNCFLRMMPHLTSLILDCCSSLNGQGLCNIAARYTVPRPYINCHFENPIFTKNPDFCP